MSQANNTQSDGSLAVGLIKPNHWIIGAREDLLLFLLTPAVLVALVLVAQYFWTMAALGVFATVLAMGHYLPGLMRAYGDPALFGRFRWRFLLAPIFFIGTAMYMARGENERQAFLIVVVLWGSWHWLMQTYGLVRIYDAKAANFDAISARLDYALCVLWFGVIYWKTDGVATVLSRFYRTGAYVSPEVIIWMTRVWLWLAIAVSVFYLVHVVRRTLAGQPPSFLKLALLGVTSLFYVYAFGFTSSHLIAFHVVRGVPRHSVSRDRLGLQSQPSRQRCQRRNVHEVLVSSASTADRALRLVVSWLWKLSLFRGPRCGQRNRSGCVWLDHRFGAGSFLL